MEVLEPNGLYEVDYVKKVHINNVINDFENVKDRLSGDEIKVFKDFIQKEQESEYDYIDIVFSERETLKRLSKLEIEDLNILEAISFYNESITECEEQILVNVFEELLSKGFLSFHGLLLVTDDKPIEKDAEIIYERLIKEKESISINKEHIYLMLLDLLEHLQDRFDVLFEPFEPTVEILDYYIPETKGKTTKN
ncbi:hypothetical protein AAFX13_00295 [Vibrio parahaemolyticus]|uniref:hypothetical protein n=1 Tax=Vibrio parahaemolyticus TaxID=670 RepID=UPI0039801677